MANSDDDLPISATGPEATPHSSNDFVDQGWVLHVNRDFTGAEQSFRTAVDKDPLNFEAFYGLAMSLKLQGRKDEAVQAFQKTIDLIRENPDPGYHARMTMLRHLAKAHMDMMQKNFGEALP